MHDASSANFEQFAIPAQTLRGSREEMLAEIDRALTGLLVLRRLIGGDEPHLEAATGFYPPAVPRRAAPFKWLQTMLTRTSR